VARNRDQRIRRLADDDLDLDGHVVAEFGDHPRRWRSVQSLCSPSTSSRSLPNGPGLVRLCLEVHLRRVVDDAEHAQPRAGPAGERVRASRASSLST
jgi:hypothetical protein